MKKEKDITHQIPTIKDVALAAGVSLKTVSRVINESNDVSSETRQKVLEAIKKVGYRPNAIARSLRVKKTFSIGVIIADITNSFYSTLVRGIEDVALSRNYSILLANSDEMLKKEKMYIKVFVEKQVEGLIIVPSAGSQEYLKTLLKHLPIVFVDRDANEIEASTVKVENKNGAYMLTRHLIQHGYSRIAFICHDVNLSTGKERFDGFEEALKESNIELVAGLIKIGNRTIDDAFEAVRDIINNNIRPQAIFTSNNIMAQGVMKALEYFSLEIPRDIALVSFDDFQLSEIFRPHLTVVSQPAYDIGRCAAELLFKQMEKGIKPEKIILPVELVIRESCGCFKKGI